jgi:type II secretory pathway predicted ATPase ExeA
MKYQALFGFNRLPFDRSLNSNELFRAPALDELNSRLRYLVETRAIGLLTSEPGCGKSTALRRLRDDLHPEQVRTLYLCDTAGNPADFFRQIALELGIEPLWSRVLTLRAIKDEIARLHSQRHLNVLLLVDEAQALRHDVLALIPLLTNFDWDSDAKIAVLLAGQTGLRQKLRLAHLEPLAQRLTNATPCKDSIVKPQSSTSSTGSKSPASIDLCLPKPPSRPSTRLPSASCDASTTSHTTPSPLQPTLKPQSSSPSTSSRPQRNCEPDAMSHNNAQQRFLPTMSNDAQDILTYLNKKVPQYPFDPILDQEFVAELIEDFNHIDILEETKAFRWFYGNQHAERLSNVRLGLRRWIANAWTRKDTA